MTNLADLLSTASTGQDLVCEKVQMFDTDGRGI